MYVLDIELYKNYLLIAAKDYRTNSLIMLEMFKDSDQSDNIPALQKLLSSNQIATFNGNHYDIPLLTAYLDGRTNRQLKDISDDIIHKGAKSWMTYRDNDLNPLKLDHIDLIDVVPGVASLKIYGGRMHAPHLESLPIHHNKVLTPEDCEQLRAYCVNDLDTTKLLYDTIKPQLELRVGISKQYNTDLRSKSDAQIAEFIIVRELKTLTGKEYRKKFAPDRDQNFEQQIFNYTAPDFVSFDSPTLKKLLAFITKHDFTLASNGSIQLPDYLKTNDVTVGGTDYKMGIGGLHSKEKNQVVTCAPGHTLVDVDVTSYYPSIILNEGLYPEILCNEFTTVYKNIFDKRVKAKKEGDKVTADTFKLCLNSSFGKFGSKYSILYSPELLLKVTITGQLALLMLIERLSDHGIEVVSANTDGIVLHYHNDHQSIVDATLNRWQGATGYTLEHTYYKKLVSRDVNNYFAVTPNGAIKSKGCFAPTTLSKNPDFKIVYDAVMDKLYLDTPIAKTINDCKDITRFLKLRKVTGGAVWRDKDLGNAIRYYYATDVPDSEGIAYALNGNTVPMSNGTRPLQDLPKTCPDNIDRDKYIAMSNKLLTLLGGQ